MQHDGFDVLHRLDRQANPILQKTSHSAKKTKIDTKNAEFQLASLRFLPHSSKKTKIDLKNEEFKEQKT